jgi:chromosomal replication initiation ATPase DnaA
MPVVALEAPDDAMLRAMIVKYAADRQLKLDSNTVEYLLARIERTFAAARAAVIALDREALSQGRAPKRGLASELFRDGRS